MRRRLISTLLAFALAALAAASTAVAVEPEWRSGQPIASTLGVPTPLGQVGGMAFWSANKGVLITGGNAGNPAGVYAYDGSGWYLYSTVCGGHEGDIAISGPDEFWTISDYAEAQEGAKANSNFEYSRTLCHFANGEVVASYAEPGVSPEAFSKMKAAACLGPADCWFAGVALSESAPSEDPFHLAWNGNSLIPVPSPVVREPDVAPMPGNVENLAFAQGRLFETASKAPYLREVNLAAPKRFLPVEVPAESTGPFVLSTEPLQQSVWVVTQNGTVLGLGPAGFEEIPTAEPLTWASGPSMAAGVEPGGGAAWIGAGFSSVEVRQVGADGTLGPIVTLPQPGEELSQKGGPEQIVCPASGQCWLATSSGWLFHLGGTPVEGVNADPLLHRLITTRPKDASSRTFVSAGLPEDNSGELEGKRGGEEPRGEPFPVQRKAPPLVVKVKQTMIGKTTLQLAFTLRATAHVQLLAKHHKKVVAKTARQTLEKGRHRLRLHLDPKHWPTSLDFEVHAVKKRVTK
jgi:hypothetical protein